jgi:hypothetical protein
MNTARIVVCSAVVLLAAAMSGACSGAATSDLFGAPQASSTSSSSSSSSSSGGSGNGSSSSGSLDGGDLRDVVQPPKDGSGPPTDDKGRVFCGKGEKGADVYCAAGAVCCAERQPNSALFTKYTCQPNATACVGQYLLPIVCDDSQDCPGTQVCCAFRSSPGGSFARYTRTACMPQGQCMGNVSGEERIRLCDEATSPDECTTSGFKCGPSQALTDFGVCAP